MTNPPGLLELAMLGSWLDTAGNIHNHPPTPSGARFRPRWGACRACDLAWEADRLPQPVATHAGPHASSTPEPTSEGDPAERRTPVSLYL